MTTATTTRCQDCQQALTPAVNEAIGELYGGGQVAPLREYLRDLVRHPLPAASDDDVLREALTRWLGFPPTALVEAVRHHEIEEPDDER